MGTYVGEMWRFYASLQANLWVKRQESPNCAADFGGTPWSRAGGAIDATLPRACHARPAGARHSWQAGQGSRYADDQSGSYDLFPFVSNETPAQMCRNIVARIP